MKFPLFCWIGGRQLLPHCKTATRKAASVFWSPDRDRHLEVTGKQQDLWQATAERQWSNKASLNFFSRHRAIRNIIRQWEHTYWRLWALWGNPHTWFWHHHSNTLSKHLRSAELTAVPTLPPEKQETLNFCQTVGNYWVVVTQLYEAHSRLQVTLAWFPQQKKISSPDPKATRVSSNVFKFARILERWGGWRLLMGGTQKASLCLCFHCLENEAKKEKHRKGDRQ